MLFSIVTPDRKSKRCRILVVNAAAAMKLAEACYKKRATRKLDIGTEIKAQRTVDGRSTSCPGKIEAFNANGSYDITYDDGTKEAGVTRSCIHALDPMWEGHPHVSKTNRGDANGKDGSLTFDCWRAVLQMSRFGYGGWTSSADPDEPLAGDVDPLKQLAQAPEVFAFTACRAK
jgi:hypothetical protein